MSRNAFDNGRRKFLKYGVSAAASSAALPFASATTAAAQSNADDQTLARLHSADSDRDRRILLKGGTVVSMDPAVGNFAQGDVLIEGTKIAAIGRDLSARTQGGGAIVVDASDMILIPGFCDPHIHSWQGQIPRIIPNQISTAPSPTHTYMIVMHDIMAPAYRPLDMYVGTLMTMLTCINAGITTVCDNSHNARSSEHSDEAIHALLDAGIRGVHASGAPREGTWDQQWPQDLYRIKERYFASEDQLVTLRMYVPGAAGSAETPELLRVRRDLDLWYSLDSGGRIPQIPDFYTSGIFNGKESYNHGGGLPVANMRAIVDHGAKVNVTPRSGGGVPTYQDWLDLGLRPGFSHDNPATYAINMFAVMHVMYASHRGTIQRERANGNPEPPPDVTTRDMLESATIRGAECCGLDHKVGTLTPGKEADIVLINTNDIHLYPRHNAITTVVQGAHNGNVDTVFIAGQPRKWRGRLTSSLLGPDMQRIRQMVDESRDYLFAATNWPLGTIDFSD
jgi:cytosine/adenosine deaminase-related metal-dependent hydrolase